MRKGPDDSQLRYRRELFGERGSWTEPEQSKPLTDEELNRVKELTRGRLNGFLSGRMGKGHKDPDSKDLVFEIPLESLALTLRMEGVNRKQAEEILDDLVSEVKGLAKTEKGYKVVDAAELLKVYGTGATQNRIVALLEASRAPLKATEIEKSLALKGADVYHHLDVLVRQNKIRLVPKNAWNGNKNFVTYVKAE